MATSMISPSFCGALALKSGHGDYFNGALLRGPVGDHRGDVLEAQGAVLPSFDSDFY